MTEDEIKVNQLIALLQLYLQRDTLEIAFPISQLHDLLHDVFYMVHNEIGRNIIPGWKE